jgi:hypothetical protein
MRRYINFSRFTGGGEVEPGHWNFRPLPPREPESNPNPPFIIGKAIPPPPLCYGRYCLGLCGACRAARDQARGR